MGDRVAMVLLHDALSPADLRVVKEAATLVQAGHDLTIYCWDRQGRLPVEEVRDGIRVARFGPKARPERMSVLRRYSVFRAVRRKIAEAIIARGCDVVHCHDLETLPIGADVKRRLRVPLIYDSHEDWPSFEASQSRVMGWLTALLERRYVGRADAVVTVGWHLASKFRRLGKDPVVLMNAPRSGDCPRVARPPGARIALGLDDGDFVLGYFGRINPGRDDELMQRAIRELGPEGIRLLLVGGPDQKVDGLRASARRLGVEKWCVFVGDMPFAEYYRTMQVCDLGMLLLRPLPHLRGVLPNKIFEYMAAGLPALSTDLPDMRTTLEDAGSIEFVPADDLEAVLRAVRALRSDPGRRKQMGASGRKAFEERFSWERQESKLIDLYARLNKRSV